jgi:hypothetical protein
MTGRDSDQRFSRTGRRARSRSFGTASVVAPLFLLTLLALAATLQAGCSLGGRGTTTTKTGSTTTSAVGATTTVTSGPGGTATTSPASSTGAFLLSTTPATLPQPSTYPQPKAVDLSKVAGLDKVTLSARAKAALATQGFVASPTPADTKAQKFWQVYEDARYRGLPVLVTTDAMLNTFHGIFDMMLQRLEEAQLMDKAIAMSQALYDTSSGQWNEATAPAAKEAAEANMAYFAVALSLLKGDGTYGGEVVRDQVQAELTLIEAAGGNGNSPVLGYLEDYSQYKPRGHYTRSEVLKRYFKGMMWYGHTAFWVNPKKPDVSEELARRLMRQAALVTVALVGEAQADWRAIYEPTAFLVGQADDLTAADLRPLVSKVFGTESPKPDALAGDAGIDSFRAEVSALPAPKILSHLSFGPGSQEEAERSFRIMGQRYIPDSYAFQQLVWRYVGAEDNMRLFPMGLDAMAVLGSSLAYDLAANDYKQAAYAHWESQQAKVKAELDGGSAEFWPLNMYTGWLDVLRQTMSAPPAAAPALMQTRAWALKSLNSALGSWTELRHDTLLYAKQSVIAEGGGGDLPQTVGYVEPYPDFYRGLGGLAKATRDGLANLSILDDDARAKLDLMVNLCADLGAIADKELAGQALTENERSTIYYFGGTLEHLGQFVSEEGRTISPADEKSPVVADVHTDLVVTMQVLEEATGYPLALYAVLPIDGTPQLLVGACYDYYEFTVPMDERLTDEEWQAQIDGGEAPARPRWTSAFIVR